MPDISMCRNEDCPKKEECYRYRAVPNNWQSWTMFEPVGREAKCDYFVPIEKGDKLMEVEDGEAS